MTSIFMLVIKFLWQYLRRYCHLPILKSWEDVASIKEVCGWKNTMGTPLSFRSFFSMLLTVEPIVPLTLVFKREVSLHNAYSNQWWNCRIRTAEGREGVTTLKIIVKVMTRVGFIMMITFQGPSLLQTPFKALEES